MNRGTPLSLPHLGRGLLISLMLRIMEHSSDLAGDRLRRDREPITDRAVQCKPNAACAPLRQSWSTTPGQLGSAPP